MSTNPKLKKIDDQIQALRRSGVSLYQIGTPKQRAGLWLMGLTLFAVGWLVGTFL